MCVYGGGGVQGGLTEGGEGRKVGEGGDDEKESSGRGGGG